MEGKRRRGRLRMQKIERVGGVDRERSASERKFRKGKTKSKKL